MRVLAYREASNPAKNFDVLRETKPHDDPYVRNNPMTVYYR